MAQRAPIKAVPIEVEPGLTNPEQWIFELKVENCEEAGQEVAPFTFQRCDRGSPIFADGKGNFVEHDGTSWVHKRKDTTYVCSVDQPPSAEATYEPPPTNDVWKLVPDDGGDLDAAQPVVTINYLPVASPEKPQRVRRHLHVVIDADVWNFAREFRSAIGVIIKSLRRCPKITVSIGSTSQIPGGLHHRVLPCLLWIRSGAVTGSADLHFEPQLKVVDVAVVCHHTNAKEAAKHLCTRGNTQCAIAVGPQMPRVGFKNQLLGPLSAIFSLFADVFENPEDIVHPKIVHDFLTDNSKSGQQALSRSGLHATATIATQFQGVSETDSRRARVLFAEEAENASLDTDDIIADGMFYSELVEDSGSIPVAADATEWDQRATARMAHTLIKTLTFGAGTSADNDSQRVFAIPVPSDSSGISENCAKAMAYAVCAHAVCNSMVGVVTFCDVEDGTCKVDDLDKIGFGNRGVVLWLNGREYSTKTVLATADEVSFALKHVSSDDWDAPNTVIVAVMSTADWEEFNKNQSSNGLATATDSFFDKRQNDPSPDGAPQPPSQGAPPAADADPPRSSSNPHTRPCILRRVHCGRDLRPCLVPNSKEAETPMSVVDISVGATVVINIPRNVHTRVAAFNLAHSGLDLRQDPSDPDRFTVASMGESALGLHRLHETIAQTAQPILSTQSQESLEIPVQNGSIVVPTREIAALQKLTVVESTVIHNNISIVTGKPGQGEQEYVAVTDLENHGDKGMFFVCRTTWASQIFFKETDTETGLSQWFFSGYMGGFYKLLTTSTDGDKLLPPERAKWVECDKPRDQQSEIDLPMRHAIRVVPSRQGADDAGSNPHLLLVTGLDVDRNDLHLSIELKFSGLGARIETAKSLIGRIPAKDALPCLAVIEDDSSSGLGHLWDSEDKFFNVDVVVLCVPKKLLGEACAQAERMCREGWVGSAIVLESAPTSETLCLVEDVLTFVRQVFQLAKETDDKTALLIGRIAAHVYGSAGDGLRPVHFFVPGDSEQYTVPYDMLRPFRSSTLKNVVVTPRATREPYSLRELMEDQSTRHNPQLQAALSDLNSIVGAHSFKDQVASIVHRHLVSGISTFGYQVICAIVAVVIAISLMTRLQALTSDFLLSCVATTAGGFVCLILRQKGDSERMWKLHTTDFQEFGQQRSDTQKLLGAVPRGEEVPTSKYVLDYIAASKCHSKGNRQRKLQAFLKLRQSVRFADFTIRGAYETNWFSVHGLLARSSWSANVAQKATMMYHRLVLDAINWNNAEHLDNSNENLPPNWAAVLHTNLIAHDTSLDADILLFDSRPAPPDVCFVTNCLFTVVAESLPLASKLLMFFSTYRHWHGHRVYRALATRDVRFVYDNCKANLDTVIDIPRMLQPGDLSIDKEKELAHDRLRKWLTVWEADYATLVSESHD